jgi:hypothetical protein
MKSEIRSQKSELRNQKSEISPATLGLNQNPPLAGQNLSSVLCRLPSVFCHLSSVVCLLAMLLGGAGCEQMQGLPEYTAETDSDFKRLSVYSHFAPEKISIMPLTEFINPGGTRQANMNLYVSLLDSFGSQIKSPCVFRFELYQKVFLRAYEFNLPLESAENQSYILQITCLCPTGRRLSDEFAIKLTK